MKQLSLLFCSLVLLSGVFRLCLASEDAPPPPAEGESAEFLKKIEQKATEEKPLIVVKKADLISVDGVQEPDFGTKQPAFRKSLNEYVATKNDKAKVVLLTSLYATLGISIGEKETEENKKNKTQLQTLVKEFANAYADAYKKNKTLLFKIVASEKVELSKEKIKKKGKPVAFYTFYELKDDSKNLSNAVNRNMQQTLLNALNSKLDELYKSEFNLSNENEFKKTMTEEITKALKNVSVTENTLKIFIESQDFKKLVNDSLMYLEDKSKIKMLELEKKPEIEKKQLLIKEPTVLEKKELDKIEEKPEKLQLPEKTYKKSFSDFAVALDAIK